MGWLHAMPHGILKLTTNELTDANLPEDSLRGGYATDETEPFPDFDPAVRACDDDGVYAHFSKGEAVTSTPYVEEDLDTIIARLSAIASSAGVASQDDGIVKPSQMLAELSTSSSTAASTTRGNVEDLDSVAISSPPPPPTNAKSHSKDTFGESLFSLPKGQAPYFFEQVFEEAWRLDDTAEDPKSMVTEPERDTSFTSGTDARKWLAELEEQTSYIGDKYMWQARFEQHPNGAPHFLDQIVAASWAPDNNAEDPKKMLAELGEQTSYNNDTDPKAMLAELERGALHGGHDSNDIDDLKALRGELAALRSASPSQMSPAIVSTEAHASSDTKTTKSPGAVDKDVVQYITLLQLEKEKEAYIKQATKELDKLIEYTVEQEKRHMVIENKAKLPRRLIVSNIAAGASVEDLKEFFYGFRHAM
jgi:hypothetical protein